MFSLVLFLKKLWLLLSVHFHSKLEVRLFKSPDDIQGLVRSPLHKSLCRLSKVTRCLVDLSVCGSRPPRGGFPRPQCIILQAADVFFGPERRGHRASRGREADGEGTRTRGGGGGSNLRTISHVTGHIILLMSRTYSNLFSEARKRSVVLMFFIHFLRYP